MDWTIHFEHLWTTAGISLYNPGPSSASITMMRHVAICSLPEPFAHPSLPRHPRMSDPPANISVELAAIVDSTQLAFQAKKKHVFLLRLRSPSFSLSQFIPPRDPSASLLVFVKGVIFQVIWIVVFLSKKIQRFKGCALWDKKTVYCAPAPPLVGIVQLPNLDVLNQPQRLPEIHSQNDHINVHQWCHSKPVFQPLEEPATRRCEDRYSMLQVIRAAKRSLVGTSGLWWMDEPSIPPICLDS